MASLLKQLTLLTLPAIVLAAQANLWAQQIVVPAGTIIQCTLEDSKVSSKTEALDDPILCDTGSLREFGVSVFPRGAYLQGRFADDRDPGHLWGKGWMQLQFDHIILPNAELPISAKVVSAPHLKVDLEGKIHGTGHARRDVVEWAIPVLWPEKIITLPMPSPRPALKQEARISLKLMEDVPLPEEVGAYNAKPLVRPGVFRPSTTMTEVRPASEPMIRQAPQPIVRHASMVLKSGQDRASAEGTLLMLKDGTGQLAQHYWFDSGQKIQFLSVDGKVGVFPIEALDYDLTVKLNRERGVTFVIREDDNEQ
jgi:hypothetical protein